MSVRDFIHDVVDVICDFFLAAWDQVVKLIKAAVRFVGRAYDFFQGMFKKTWEAVKSGANKLYVIVFKPDIPVVSEAEKEVMSMFGEVINEVKEEGRVPDVPFFSVSMNNNTSKVEELKSFSMGRDIKDQTMKGVIGEANKQKRAVSVVGLS